MAERTTEAHEVLQQGLQRGLWWAPDLLDDSDLDSVRALPAWSEVEHRCSEAAERFSRRFRPEPLIRPSSAAVPAGTVLTFHAYAADPVAHAARWFGAVPPPWTVVVPAGTVPLSEKLRAWPRRDAAAGIGSQLHGLRFPSPAVLAGYSQGGGVAADLAWAGTVDVAGLILVAPALGTRRWDSNAPRGVPAYIVVGEHDRFLQDCLELGTRLHEAGVPVLVDQRPGLGHRVPEDLEETVTEALEWIGQHAGAQSGGAQM